MPKINEQDDSNSVDAIEQGSLLSDHAKAIKEIYGSKKDHQFDIAFLVAEQYEKIWKKRSDQSFGFYLTNLIRVGKLKSKESTLRLAYRVAQAFPDLENPQKRSVSFDCYREIATAKLTKEKKDDLRKIAEDHGYSGKEVRKFISKMKIESDPEFAAGKAPHFEKTFTYQTEAGFLHAIRNALQGPNRPKAGAKFLLKKIHSRRP